MHLDLFPLGSALTMSLEILNGAFMAVRSGASGKRAKVASSSGLRVCFARIEAIFPGSKFSNHKQFQFERHSQPLRAAQRLFSFFRATRSLTRLDQLRLPQNNETGMVQYEHGNEKNHRL